MMTDAELISDLAELGSRMATVAAVVAPGSRISLSGHDVVKFSRLVLRGAERVKQLHGDVRQMEARMGKAAQAITELQGELTTAKSNAYDADDLTAIQGVLGGTGNTSSGQQSSGQLSSGQLSSGSPS